MPSPNRRSSSSSSSRWRSPGKARVPPPTTTGVTKRCSSSTTPRAERLGGEARAANGDVARRLGLHLSHRVCVEVPLDPSSGARNRFERPRVDDLVGRPPDLREVAHDLRLSGHVGHVLPGDHRLVHPAAVEVGADRPLEVVDEGVHLLVGGSPVKRSRLILDVAVQRCDGRVDQLHCATP